MAQRHLWIWFLCLQTWSEAAGKDADPMVMNGILGESVTFLLNIQEPKKIDNIAWTSQSSVAFIKPGVNKAEVTITQGTYKGRIEIIDQKYDLVIRDLRMEDAGTYKADINEENEETITKIYYLHIYRPTIEAAWCQSQPETCSQPTAHRRHHHRHHRHHRRHHYQHPHPSHSSPTSSHQDTSLLSTSCHRRHRHHLHHLSR